MKLKGSKIIFSALADETRLRILNLLSKGELCVCDLMSVLGEPQSKVSRHLAYLRRFDLVEARKEGLWVYYRLSKQVRRTFRAVLNVLNQGSSEFEELRKDLAKLQKSKKTLVSCCE